MCDAHKNNKKATKVVAADDFTHIYAKYIYFIIKRQIAKMCQVKSVEDYLTSEKCTKSFLKT